VCSRVAVIIHQRLRAARERLRSRLIVPANVQFLFEGRVNVKSFTGTALVVVQNRFVRLADDAIFCEKEELCSAIMYTFQHILITLQDLDYIVYNSSSSSSSQ